jgi:hypothetical protein
MSKQTKEERKEYQKQYRLDNKEYFKQYRLDNKEEIQAHKKQWHLDNKEKVNGRSKQWRLDNKEEIQEYQKQYYLDNKEERTAYNKQYNLDNKEYFKQYRLDNKEEMRRYENKRYHSDPLYKFKDNCRTRTYQAFKAKSWRKNGGTEKLLGCDWKTAMNHIESQFVGKNKWMNWDNHGEWHIDHYTPLASANTIEEMTPLFHYTNLRPLLAEDNIRKGDKILN